MAGIWLSVILFGLLVVITIVGLMANSGETVRVVGKNTVLRLDLSGSIVDHATTPSLEEMISSGGKMPMVLSDIIDAIDAASDDSNIDGILLECSGGFSAGLAQSEEIIAALKRFRTSGKWVWAYGDNYSQGEYFVSTASDSIFVNPVGMIDVHGLSATMFFLKDLLDKVGVEAQVIRVGTYKSAVEPFLLSDISEANREQTMAFLGSMWSVMKDSIASARKVVADSVDSWANNFEFARDTKSYVADRLADRLLYHRQLTEILAAKTGKEKPDMIDFADYVAGRSRDSDMKPNEPTIAVLFAQGDITESGEGGIASERLVPEILELAEDKSIDGLILRVNSGGGSAFASEQIWEALEQFKKQTGKPFYVSMGNVAASGGYYISCGADKIFASPLTLTGSIGIFGVIPNVEPLLKDKLGVNTVTLATNTGSMPTFLNPMDESQRGAMQDYVNRGYDLFLKRVADSRKVSVDSIAAVAQGRVWSGETASTIGLVDNLGGLYDCIVAMAKTLGSTASDVNIRRYPKVTRQWWEMLLSMENPQLYTVFTQGLDPQSKLCEELMKRVATIYPLQCRSPFIYVR